MESRGLFKLVVLVLPLILAACSPSGGSFDPTQEANSLFFRNGSGSITPTIYFLPQYKKDLRSCDGKTRSFISPEGRVLETLCEYQWKECLLQGTCKIIDGNRWVAVHFHSKRGNDYRFTYIDLSKCHYGIGAREYICLDPYHSVAADLSYQKLGDVIFVPAVRGALLPDGTTHDGYFIVRDTGGVIDGIGRFDFFIGTDNYLNKKNAFVKLGLGDPKTHVPFQVVNGDLADRVRQKRNYPGLPVSTVAPSFNPTPMGLKSTGHTLSVSKLVDLEKDSAKD